MSTHECVSNASNTSSPPEDSEFSDSSSDKGKGASKPTHLCTSKRRIGLVIVASAQDDDNVDDFGIQPPHAKKPTSSKASTKGGSKGKKAFVKMLVSKVRGVKKVS
jgi:hypothetical protein